MKISKYNALKILAKHLVKKFGYSDNQVDMHSIATSLSIMLNVHTPNFIKSGVMDDSERINVLVLEEKAKELFTYVPALTFPMSNTKITVTKEEIFKLIKDLKNHCDVEEVIYLPNK